MSNEEERVWERRHAVKPTSAVELCSLAIFQFHRSTYVKHLLFLASTFANMLLYTKVVSVKASDG
jgi:hypothetical protein